MKEIDFLPEWYKNGRRRKVTYRTQYVALGGIFLIMVAWNFFAARTIAKAEAELVRITIGNTEVEAGMLKFAGLKGQCDSVRTRSVDGSKGFYSYERDGARKVVNFPDRPSRIHTYGNSFTHCDQVSDGETWQEYLAAHIAEPIRNYGVGGYSVYQAYKRMLEVEKEDPAEYIILNIWDDDHFRNLDSWRAIRFGHRTACGYTLPHLRVNFRQDRLQEMGNMWLDPQGVYHLCDEEFVWAVER